MQLLPRRMSNLLCCFGLAEQHEDQRSSSLRTLPQHGRINLPSMPIANSLQVNRPGDELERIFSLDSGIPGTRSRTKTTPRCNIAQGSLDLNFSFGSDSYDKKAHGRLEQIAHHVRKKLSDGGLDSAIPTGETSSAQVANRPIVGRSIHDGDDRKAIINSQRSAGLNDLLAFRAVSDGGYDSDARSLLMPVLQKGSESAKYSPYLCDRSQATVTKDRVPVGIISSDHNTDHVRSAERHESNERESESFQVKPTPPKISSSDALLSDSDESPTAALQRLSDGIANGIIGAPGTPELRAMSSPGAADVHSDRRLSLTSDSSRESTRRPFEIGQKIRLLSDHVQTARKTDSAAPEIGSRHVSLISDIDPILLDYLAKHASGHDLDQDDLVSSPTTAIRTHNGTVRDSRSFSETSESVFSSDARRPTDESSSTLPPDEHSVHLFDMRISQQLASKSRLSESSDGLSNNQSRKSVASGSELQSTLFGSTSTAPRYPSYVALEHNRRPSDPRTKRIFEQPDQHDQHVLQRSRISSALVQRPSSLLESETAYTPASRVSPSPCYSDSDNPRALKEVIDVARRGSLTNANSMAIGGRSVSETNPSKHMGHNADFASSPGDSFWRSISALSVPLQGSRAPHQSIPEDELPEGSGNRKLLSIAVAPDQVSRRGHGSTEANEELSEVSFDGHSEQQNEKMSEISAEATCEDRNEILSEIDARNDTLPNRVHNGGKIEAESWLSQGKRSGWGFTFVDKSPERHNTTPNKSRTTSPDLQDSTKTVRQQHLQPYRRTPAYKGVFITPQFDRGRQRNASTISDDEHGPLKREKSVVSLQRRRSQSAELVRASDLDENPFKGSRHQRSFPLLRVFGSKQGLRGTQRSTEDVKTQKKSLRWVNQSKTAEARPRGGSCKDHKALSEAFFRDTDLGIWGRFSSHDREKRNGPAGRDDQIQVRDFQQEHDDSSTGSFGSQSRASTRAIELEKSRVVRSKTKSMNFGSLLDGSAKVNRKKIIGSIRHLCRTKSSELRAYVTTYGHRTSISVGGNAEYPELECLPGEGMFARSTFRRNRSSSGFDGSNGLAITMKNEASDNAGRAHSPWVRNDTNEWGRLYRDCVGSLSALKSENDVASISNVDTQVTGATDTSLLTFNSSLNGSSPAGCDGTYSLSTRKSSKLSKQPLTGTTHGRQRPGDELRMPGSFD